MADSNLINPYEQIWKTRDLRALETPIEVENTVPEWKRALGAFGKDMQATGYGIAALGAQGLENIVGENELTKGVTDWGLEGYNKSIEESQSGRYAPSVARIEDIKGASDAMDWASYQLGKGLPMLASLALSGGVGGAIARVGAQQGIKQLAKSAIGDVVKKGVATKAVQAVEGQIVTKAMQEAAAQSLRNTILKGTMVGGFAGSFGLEGGLAFGEQAAEGVAPADAVKSAIAVGGINGALEFLPFYHVAKQLGAGSYAKKKIADIIANDEGLSKKAIALATAKELGGRAAKGGAVGLGAEGITEGLQELTSIAGLRWAKEDPLFAALDADDWSRIKNAIATGALVGGVAAGGGATLVGPETQEAALPPAGTPPVQTGTPPVTPPIDKTRTQDLEAIRSRIDAALAEAQATGNKAGVKELQQIKARFDSELGVETPVQETPGQVAPVQEAPVQTPPVEMPPASVVPKSSEIDSMDDESFGKLRDFVDQNGLSILAIPGESAASTDLRLRSYLGRLNGRKIDPTEPLNLQVPPVTQPPVPPRPGETVQLKRGEEIILTPPGQPETRVIPTAEEKANLQQLLGERPTKPEVIPNAEEVQTQTEAPVNPEIPTKPGSDNTRFSMPRRQPNAVEATMEEFEAVRKQFQERQAQETPFKNWFGKGTPGVTSDSAGAPITLYHGTNNPDFNKWDSSRAGESSSHPTSGLGFFMTADKGSAARYGNNLMALHAKIQNPYELTDADLTSIETKEDAAKLRKNLMSKGYDGAVVKAPGAKPYVIAFESKQVKFVTNEKPTDSEDFRYSMPKGTFYSGLSRAVEGLSQKKASGPQWASMLSNMVSKGQIKQEELDWMGVDEWLKEQGVVSKEDVLKFVKDREVTVEETELGNIKDENNLLLDRQFSQQSDKVKQALLQIGKDTNNSFVPGYNNDLFGEDIYQSLLMMVANEDKDSNKILESAGIDPNLEYVWLDYVNGNEEKIVSDYLSSLGIEGMIKAEVRNTKWTLPGGENQRELVLTVPSIKPFNTDDTTHYGDVGGGRAVAWVRFNDRVDEDGDKALFIEEIQSKRHQEGKEKGYAKGGIIDPNLLEIKQGVGNRGNIVWRFYDGDNHVHSVTAPYITTKEAALEEAKLDFADNPELLHKSRFENTAVPNAPFKQTIAGSGQTLSGWAGLAFKRMLRYAVENGYDKIAWTNGEQQAKRYEGAGEGFLKRLYDEMIPNELNNYIKKWGARVDKTQIKFGDKSASVHSVKITPAMRDSVMQGQRLFSFAGPKAATADLMSLETAEKRIALGDNPEVVRQETGWHQGADKKWRFEISDEDIKWKKSFDSIPESELFNNENPIPLSEIIDHPKLFEAYPFLKDINLIKRKGLFDFEKRTQGWFDDDYMQIGVTPYAKDPLSTILHEMQHIIQMEEEFAKGGNESSVWEALPVETKENVAKGVMEKLKEKVAKLKDELEIATLLGDNTDLIKDYNEALTKYNQMYNEFRKYEVLPYKNEEHQKKAKIWEEARDNLIKAEERISNLFDYKDVRLFNLPFEIDIAVKTFSRLLEKPDYKNEITKHKSNLNVKITDLLDKLTAIKSGNEKAIRAEANLYEFYKKLAGETEARLTQARQGMNEEERKERSPQSMQEYPNEEQIVVMQGGQSLSAERGSPIRPITPDELRANINSVMGENWIQQAEAAGIIEVIDGAGTQGESGSWAGDKFRLYTQTMPADGSPLGVLLHEGSHAPTFNEILGDSLEGYLKDLDTLAENGNETARNAVAQATIAVADVLGIKHNLMQGGNKTDLKNVQALIEERRPGLLAEEKLAYFIQYASETKEGAGLLSRLINAIKAWFAQTKLGQTLKEAGIGFELNEAMAVEWAKASLRNSLAEAQQAARVRELVIAEAKQMPPSVRLGRALEVQYSVPTDATQYSQGKDQEVSVALPTEIDKDLIARFESEPKIKAYRAMQLIDGKLYPPMSAVVEGRLRDPSELGKWEKAAENPELAENGFFKLNKGNKSAIKARYNPYFHTSLSPLNDQFSSAYKRDNLVTVEVEIPQSELTSGYKAKEAKDSVGIMSWHSGPVSSKLKGEKARKVILTRYAKLIRIVPDSEVAASVFKLLDGENISVPANVITPSLRTELENLGLKIDYSKMPDVYYSMGLQEFKETLWTDPTDSRIELVNKPGLLQRWRADFVDFFAEIEKKSKDVYEAYSLQRSKKAALIEQSRQEYFLPLRKLIAESPWTAQEVGDMLAARHIKVDNVNIGLAERASDSYVKDLLKALSKQKEKELIVARENVKDGKMPDGTAYIDVNGNRSDMSSSTKRKLMFDLMNKYAAFEIRNPDGKQVLSEEWEIFKDAAGGFSNGGVGKSMVRTVDDVLKLVDKDRAKFNEIANLFDAANRHTLDILEYGGLITAAEHARLLLDKSAYAPLRRESYNVNREIEQLFQKAGQGGSKQIATRAGTANLSEPTLVLQNALAKIEAAAAAAERNLANKELYKVVVADREGWKPWFSIVEKDKYVTHDEDGFLQEKNATAFNQADITLINDGKKLVIRPNMHNERAIGFVRAVNNLDAQILNGPMKVLSWINGIVRWVNVSASPVFLMMNAIRDPFTAAYNLQASEAAPYTKDIFQNYGKAFKALKKVFLDGNRDPTDADVQWVERWERAGGRTSFVESLREMDDTWRSFDAQVARRQGSLSGIMAAKDKWIDGLENFNILFENVMRFSTFQVLTEKGVVTDSRAAKISQDLTTNFNRRGYKTQALGVWWLFFNATVQGNYQVIRNLLESKRVQAAVGGTIVFALMLDLLGRAIADDWDEIPEWDKERFIIFPVKVGGDFIKIPAPWVYNVVWRTGGMLGETLAGIKKPQDVVLDIASMTVTAFSPLGKPGSIAQAIAPTGADPFVQILENKDFTGNPLGPEGFPGAGKKANSELLWSSTPKGYQSFARMVNEFTGGSAVESGVIDLRPADYQVLVKFLTGSLGRFMSDATFGMKETFEKGIEGPKDIPIVKEMFSDPYDPMRSQKYHTNIAGIYGAHKLEKMYSEGPDKDLIKLQEVRRERRKELQMYAQAQDIEKQLKSLRVRLKAAQNREDRKREKEIKQRMERVQEQFNERYKQRIG